MRFWLLVCLHCLLPSLTSPAQILDRRKMKPCQFNPDCLCSNSGDDLGAVDCTEVPMADLPPQLENTRVFALTLAGNGLRKFPVGKLRDMGAWSLEISNNNLNSIPSLAFSGLERSLWCLVLRQNMFTRIPSDSISRLEKLNHLDLSDNYISDIDQFDLKSLSSSLETLILAGNSLTSVPEGVFWNLKQLLSLDLSRNNIINIHSMAFQNGVPLLSTLNLANNLLGKIPFMAISSMKTLKTLDLSNNRIEMIEDSFSKIRLKLDKLNLQENNIRVISKTSFQNFQWINFTSLRNNPINTIQDHAFLETGVKELDFHNCHIGNLNPGAFRGLERILESLDLSSNRLSFLPSNVFEDFDIIRKLSVGNNMLALSPNISFSSFRYTVEDLDLQGDHMRYIPMREMGIMRSLRKVAIASTRDYGNLRPSQFEDFPPGLEVLNLVDSNIKVVRSNAFYHIPSVSRLDLSGNKIVRIEDVAFREIGKSLLYLKMSHALHTHELPNKPFRSLTALLTLDLSDNHIRVVPLDTFHHMNRLEKLFLQDNEINAFHTGTFHSQANSKLQVLDLSFNRIEKIEYDMFRFESLELLHLDDNRIEMLESRSFVEMRNLKCLTLEGNKISKLEDETFQNLHSLRWLNLAYNSLTNLNFDAFDYVGSLSFTSLDLSHNKIENLTANKTSRYSSNSNIRSLDLSHNLIRGIHPGFFQPVRSMLKMLDLSHNQLSVVSTETLGRLKKLTHLDLSVNQITEFQPTTLEESRGVQVLNISYNILTELGATMLNRQENLRVLDLSFNKIENLPEGFFSQTKLEIFRMAFNKLNEIPVKALNPVQSSLKHLDLSGNRIKLISDTLLNQIQNIVYLDLSFNSIYQIDEKAFCCSPALAQLSLSHNPLKVVSTNIFQGLMHSLEHLDLSNTSLTILPSFHLPKLVHLNMSSNKLTFVPSTALANMSTLRTLDLSNNYLPSPPSMVWHIMPRLRELSIARNPIKSLQNESFLSLDRLESLDISHMDLDTVELGTFGPMPNLKEARMSVGRLPNFNVGEHLRGNIGLQHLHLVLQGGPGPGDLREELQSSLPASLSRVTLEAAQMPALHPAALKHLSAARLSFSVISDSVMLERDLFLNLGRVQNLTIDLSGSTSNSPNHTRAELANPATKYKVGIPNSVFLLNLNLGEKSYPCSCYSLGWVAKWLRRKRALLCSSDSYTYYGGTIPKCRQEIRTLRAARCENYESGVLETLHNYLECLSFNSAPGHQSSGDSLVTILVLIISLHIIL